MALGKKDRDSTPTPTSFEVNLNDPARKRDKRNKERLQNPNTFRKDPDRTYAFGSSWKTRSGHRQIDKDSKGELWWDDVT
jgi:hypothetical protein